MIVRNDLLPPDAPPGLEVVQLTTGSLPACHLYMEAQVFTPDSTRFLLHESAGAHGGSRDDPRHRVLLCDLGQEGALSPLTVETGATAPSVSPDGMFVYYFVDETSVTGGRLTLKRTTLDGTDRQTLLVLDAPLPGVGRRPSRPYPLSTIRSDGRKLALSCFLGDGAVEGVLWGLLVFDLVHPGVELILQGQSWCNVHPQYCRSAAPEFRHDLLIQENHGNTCDAFGTIRGLTGGTGADIHVLRDDGTDFRSMPWGRDGNERCQGHQCWRGISEWAITSTRTRMPAEDQLIESLAVSCGEHLGAALPGGIRNDLSRDYPEPHFFHFATDRRGSRIVSDTAAADQGGRVFIAELGQPGRDAAFAWTCIAHPRSSWGRDAHIHPFLSPDGLLAFFNSDESGIVQAYMVRGLPPVRIQQS